MGLRIFSKFRVGNQVTISQCDCLELLKQIPNDTLNLIITSPPYNIGKEYENKMNFDHYLDLQKRVITECIKKLHPDGSICWQVGNNIIGQGKEAEIIPLDIVLYKIFKANQMILRNRIIWHFGHGLNTNYRFSGRHESILWFSKSDNYTFNLDEVRIPQKYPGKKHYKGPNKGLYSGNPKGKNPSDVWEIPNVKANHVEKTDHPCQFPIALVERLIKVLTNPGDIVFDPYLGAGTITAACVRLDRKSVGSDIEPSYCKIAKTRTRESYDGHLPVREDKPVYIPSKNSKLTKNPFS